MVSIVRCGFALCMSNNINYFVLLKPHSLYPNRPRFFDSEIDHLSSPFLYPSFFPALFTSHLISFFSFFLFLSLSLSPFPSFSRKKINRDERKNRTSTCVCHLLVTSTSLGPSYSLVVLLPNFLIPDPLYSLP